MPTKPVKEYTNKELKKSIETIEEILCFYGKIKYLDKEGKEAINESRKRLQKHLQELHKERSRRIRKGDYSPDP